MRTAKTALLAAGAVAASVVLAACRDDEKGRPLAYDKGHYAGKFDNRISDEARRMLADRVQHQSGLDSGSGGAPSISGVSSSADVRPPAPRK